MRVEYSCISAGTELAGVSLSGMPLYRRALKQPENVARVLEMMRDQGVKRTLDRVQGKLSARQSHGLFGCGPRHCAGLPGRGLFRGRSRRLRRRRNCESRRAHRRARQPGSADSRRRSRAPASTVTLGAIALQGVRRATPTLGETVVVVGLGILGQMTAQMLAANGCRVIGIDLAHGPRIKPAREKGMAHGIDPTDQDYIAEVRRSDRRLRRRRGDRDGGDRERRGYQSGVPGLS